MFNWNLILKTTNKKRAIKKPNISAQWTFHELFHILILAGSFFHYLAVYFYVL